LKHFLEFGHVAQWDEFRRVRFAFDVPFPEQPIHHIDLGLVAESIGQNDALPDIPLTSGPKMLCYTFFEFVSNQISDIDATCPLKTLEPAPTSSPWILGRFLGCANDVSHQKGQSQAQASV